MLLVILLLDAKHHPKQPCKHLRTLDNNDFHSITLQQNDYTLNKKIPSAISSTATNSSIHFAENTTKHISAVINAAAASIGKQLPEPRLRHFPRLRIFITPSRG